jgi:hypothetical protein
MEDEIPSVFTPDNEPYLGRPMLAEFDQEIESILEQSNKTAALTHTLALTDQQNMACITIPQAISIILSIRELVRQGYLFGANILVRSLVERAAILLYIKHYPSEIEIWNQGWQKPSAPDLSRMLDKISSAIGDAPEIRGKDITASMNSLLHGKPDSASLNLVDTGLGQLGFAPSKILNRPDLCDDLCEFVIPWIAVIHAMMAAYFPQEKGNNN